MEYAIKRESFKSKILKVGDGIKSNDPTKFYTKGEDIVNAITHGLGSLVAIVGTTVLVTLSALYSDWVSVLVSLVYGLSLITLYTMSTLYHAMTLQKAKKVLRVFDHTSIYLLIAGSYTPISIIALGDTWKGWALCIAVWALAILGIVLSAISLTKFKIITMVLYVTMGWLCVFAINDIINALSSEALWFLVAGGVTYTVGIVFYSLKKIKFMHGIWHLFVIGGSVLQYICIAFYVMPTTYNL